MPFNPIVLFLVALLFGGQAGYFWLRQGYYRHRLSGRNWVTRAENPVEFISVVIVFSAVALFAATAGLSPFLGTL